MKKALPLVVAAAAALGCASLTGVKETKLASGEPAKPREKGCALEFLREEPKQPFAALADLEAHVTAPPAAGAREVLRDRACQLGADAVVVHKEQTLNAYGHVLVAGTAIRYLRQPGEGKPAEPVDL